MPKKAAKKAAKQGLTPEDAQKLLRANQAKLVQKSKDPSKTLTATERKYLEELSARAEEKPVVPAEDELPRYVTTWGELYKRLNISDATLREWRKIYAHEIPKTTNNGAHDVYAWDEWAKSKGLRTQGKSIDSRLEEEEDDGIEESMDAIKKRELKAKADEREIKVAILRGHYLHRDDVRAAVLLLVNETVKQLRDRFENELPAVCAGGDAAFIREESSKVIDGICKYLHENQIAVDDEEEAE